MDKQTFYCNLSTEKKRKTRELFDTLNALNKQEMEAFDKTIMEVIRQRKKWIIEAQKSQISMEYFLSNFKKSSEFIRSLIGKIIR